MSSSVRFTISDLALLPEDGNRYEIIDGDLHVSTQPHWRHQFACGRLFRALDTWDDQAKAGLTVEAPGVIFAADDAVAPNVVWVSRGRLPRVFGDDGTLYGAPDLVVEVLSPGPRNEERDRDLKLNLYSRQGVREYWIVDGRDVTVQVYRREGVVLRCVATLTAEDTVTSPLLPGFAWPVINLEASSL